MTNDYGNLELHTVLLSAMKDIDRICRENGLRYYLYAGTLLGAMNFKGFIPWDDDVDVVMFPDDFQKFCTILNRDYRESYEIQTFYTDQKWYSMMNKILIRETNVSSCHGDCHPIYIDLSILHNYPDQNWRMKVQEFTIKWLNWALCVKTGVIVPTSLNAKLTIGLLSKVSRRRLGKWLNRVLERYDNCNTEYVGILCNTLTVNPYTGRSGYLTDRTRREWHENPRYISFEDTEFMTISDPEKDLVQRYGSHWQDPYPEEKRITKHDVKSYEISAEVRKRVGL